MPNEQDLEDLIGQLRGLDGKSYKAYKDIRGSYGFEGGTLHIRYVQGDPFAAPSRVEIELERKELKLPASVDKSTSRRIAAEDFLVRELNRQCRRHSQSIGTGKGGQLFTARPSQAVLIRSGVLITESHVYLRLRIGLPAQGRRIMGHAAARLVGENLLDLIDEVAAAPEKHNESLVSHMDTYEDADYIRSQLVKVGRVAFVADGSLLPRQSGVEDGPLTTDNAVPFKSPESLRITMDCPNRGPIAGMGISEGITLIVGGGYHGKSTLLRALEAGIFNHIPGDGREFVITRRDTFKIRAEDGRAINHVNLSSFMSELPGNVDTRTFYSTNASGSTSQAANIMEAIEAGAQCLLIDEDTAATNLMIRDERMQHLITQDREPITPLIDRIKQLAERRISTILVIGGSGDYFEKADLVIGMDHYIPSNLTEQARLIAKKFPSQRQEDSGSFPDLEDMSRILNTTSIDTSKGRKLEKVRTTETRSIQVGSDTIDLSRVEQLYEEGQLQTMAHWLIYLSQHGSRQNIREIVSLVDELPPGSHFENFKNSHEDGLSEIRGIDLAATLNRLRSLSVDSGRNQ